MDISKKTYIWNYRSLFPFTVSDGLPPFKGCSKMSKCFRSYLGLKLVRIYFVLFPFWQLIYYNLLQIRLCFITTRTMISRQHTLKPGGFLSTALLSQPSVSRKSDPEVRNQGLFLLCRSRRHRCREGRHGRCWQLLPREIRHHREC